MNSDAQPKPAAALVATRSAWQFGLLTFFLLVAVFGVALGLAGRYVAQQRQFEFIAAQGGSVSRSRSGGVSIFFGFEATVKAGDLRRLSTIPDMDRLDVHSADMDDSAFDGFTGAPWNRLMLYNTRVTDKSAAHVRRLTSLISLEVGYSGFTDAAIRDFAALPALKRLGLSGMDIGDAGVRELAGMRSLETLDLAGTRVTDEGLAHLHGLASLRKLNLSGTTVTPEGIAALRQALPHCGIEQ